MEASSTSAMCAIGIAAPRSVSAEAICIAQPGLPVISPVTEFRDVFGVALTNMINGADPATELKKATAEFQAVLDKSEKG